MDTNIAVIEWSPSLVRGYDPLSRQTVSGKSVSDVLGKIGSPRSVGLCLGRRASLIRDVHLPDVGKQEGRMVLKIRLETLFPAMEEDLAFDYVKGTHRSEDGVLATVAGVKSEILRKALQELRSAGCSAEWVAPTSLGAVTVARALGHDDAVVVESVAGQFFVDVVRHGSLVFSRSTVDSGSVEERHSEVLRSLAAYGLHSAAVIAVKGTDLGGDVRVVEDGTLQAMATDPLSDFNIELPEDIVHRAKARAAMKVRVAVVLWLVAVAAGVYVYLDRAGMAQAYATAAMSQQSKRDKVKQEMNDVSAKVKMQEGNKASLDTAFAPSQPITDVLTLVSNTLPEGAWLTGVTFERGKDIQIRGTAIRGETVSNYVSELALNNRLRNVVLQFANNTEIENTPVIQFSVTAHVVGNFPLANASQKRAKTR